MSTDDLVKQLAEAIEPHFPTEYAGGWGWCNHYHVDGGDEPFEFLSFEGWARHVAEKLIPVIVERYGPPF